MVVGGQSVEKVGTVGSEVRASLERGSAGVAHGFGELDGRVGEGDGVLAAEELSGADHGGFDDMDGVVLGTVAA